MPMLVRETRARYEQLGDLLDSLAVPALGCGPHGRRAWVNAAARALFGAAGDAGSPAALTRMWGSWHHPDRRPMAEHETPLARALAGEAVRDTEVMVNPPGGAPRYFLATGHLVGRADAVIVLREVTARRRTNQLNECQRRVAVLLSRPAPPQELLPEVVETIGAALEWAAVEYWAVDAVGQVLRREVVWDPRRSIPRTLPVLLEPNQGLAGRAWRSVAPVWAVDLREHPTSAAQLVDWGPLRAGLAVPVPGGRTVVALMVFYSDSPAGSADARAALLPGIAAMIGQFLERRRAERLDAELTESRDDYLNLIGHEVRTPLAVIESCADLLADDPALRGDQAELLAVLRRNVTGMHTLVGTLLDMAAIRSGDAGVARAPVDLAEVCRDAAAAARAAGATVAFDAPGRVVLDGDADRLRQAVGELLRVIDDGGPIGMDLRADDTSTVLTVTQARPRSPAAAPGAGVPGTALGFSLVRAIVEAHRGELTLQDSTGRTAAYTMRLPTGAGPG